MKGQPTHPDNESFGQKRFSIRTLLICIALLALAHPWWTEWYMDAMARRELVPTDYNQFPKVSPFTAIDFEDGRTRVSVNGRSYDLLAINGVKTDRLLRIAGLAFDKDRAEKRFAEDLPAVLHAAGVKANPQQVELSLLDADSGRTLVIPDAPMTRENRNAIYRRRH